MSPRHGDKSLIHTRWALTCVFMLALGMSTSIIGAPPSHVRLLTLSSPDLRPDQPFPQESILNGFGCEGANASPSLSWTNVPIGTKSFALTLFDRDEHGTPSGWWHWVVYDIPANVDHLKKNAGTEDSKQLPPGARQGRNDDSSESYAGPCPDEGDPPHHYIWTLYALSVATLPVPAQASGANVTYTAHQYTLGTANLILLHGRAKPTRLR